MDELEKNRPDDFWRKAFDEAAETPPARVWDTIERRLDESNGPKIIPLWGVGLASSGPVIWGTSIAAALALLIVGWWAITTPSDQQAIARPEPAHQIGPVAVSPVVPTHSSASTSSGQSSEAVASVGKTTGTLTRSSAPSVHQPWGRSAEGSGQFRVAQSTETSGNQANPLRIPLRSVTTLSDSPRLSTTNISTSAAHQMAGTSFDIDRANALSRTSSNQVDVVAFKQLKGKPLRMRSPGNIQRIVWIQPAELPITPESTKEKHKKRELWASVSAMPGAFNPLVSMRSYQSDFSNALAATAINTNQGSVNSRANFSVAYQAGAGVQLNERWSVESGIGYLAGRSTVDAPTQSATYYGFAQGAVADRNVVVSNQYVDALRNSSSNRLASSPSATSLDKQSTSNAYISNTNYSSQTRETLSNDYQYMQVPVQVGYQLRPRKRLGLAVLGGLLTNIFVRNTVGNNLVVTAKDGVYRPVSLAATMGARVRYRSSGRWSASLAGLYQPSLESGTHADSQVQVHPTSTGMSFGVDYHF